MQRRGAGHEGQGFLRKVVAPAAQDANLNRSVQRPNAGATTPPPPPAMTAAPNAPTTDTSCKDLNNEPGLQGGFANGRDGKSIEQVDMNQDMSAMTDDGLI